LVWIDAKFADGREKTHVKIAMAHKIFPYGRSNLKNYIDLLGFESEISRVVTYMDNDFDQICHNENYIQEKGLNVFIKIRYIKLVQDEKSYFTTCCSW